MNAPDTVVGFDGSLTRDVSLVVMHRGLDGNWQVETTDGPDASELSRIAAELARRSPAPAPLPQPESSLQEQVLEWLVAHGGGTLEVDDAQKEWLRQIYSGSIRAGRLSHHLERATAADPERPAAVSN